MGLLEPKPNSVTDGDRLPLLTVKNVGYDVGNDVGFTEENSNVVGSAVGYDDGADS